MNYLLDTHVIIWAAMRPERLSKKARELILEPESEKFISTASLWEISLKMSLKKLDLGSSFEEFVELQIANDFHFLPSRVPHYSRLTSLPWYHRDPFDRLLISQAIQEDLTLITADKAFDGYQVKTVW